MDELEDPTVFQPRNVHVNFKNLNELLSKFWNKWQKEYLLALRERFSNSSGTQRVPLIGEVVLICDDGKRLNWKLGVITQLVYGSDKLIRSAYVKCKNNILMRPISKLVPLEIGTEPELDDVPLQRVRRKAMLDALDKMKKMD